MKKSVGKWLVLSLTLLWLGSVGLWAQVEPQKITVKAQEATIHAKPDAESQVIERPPVGSVYEVVKKVGEWYEIKLPSRLGMVITGFIQEKFIETEKAGGEEQKVVKEEPVPPMPPPPVRKAKIGYVSLGGLYDFLQMGYDYSYDWFIYNQSGAIYDSVYSQNVFGFQLGMGIFVMKNVSIDLGFSSITKTLESFYALDLPNPQILDNIAYAEKSGNSKIKKMMFNLGLNFHLLNEGRARPYLGGGVSYVNGEIELLKDMYFIETFFSDKHHEVEITEVKIGSETVSSLGFYGKAGVDVEILDALIVFGEGQYLVAKKEVPHPLASTLADKEEMLEINLGGASVVLGVRIRF